MKDTTVVNVCACKCEDLSSSTNAHIKARQQHECITPTLGVDCRNLLEDSPHRLVELHGHEHILMNTFTKKRKGKKFELLNTVWSVGKLSINAFDPPILYLQVYHTAYSFDSVNRYYLEMLIKTMCWIVHLCIFQIMYIFQCFYLAYDSMSSSYIFKSTSSATYRFI